MASKLSYAKFTDLLKTHDYITSIVYYIISDKKHEKHAIFFECRLPKTQKNILVYVPPRYSMIIPKHVNPKLIELIKAPYTEDGRMAGTLTEKSVQYLLNLRGPLINSDIAVISVDGICHSKFNGETVCYFLKDNMASEESEDIAEDEAETAAIREAKEISQIEKDLVKAAAKLKIAKTSMPEKTKIEEPIKIEENPVNTNTNTNIPITNTASIQPNPDMTTATEFPRSSDPSSVRTEPLQTQIDDKTVDGVELVFEDDETIQIAKKDDKLSKAGSSSNSSSSSSSDSSDSSSDSSSGDSSSDSSSDDSSRKKHGKKFSKSAILKLSHRSNYVDVEELDVQMGIVYVVIDVDVIHKKFDIYESEALSIYEQIDDNEIDIREERVGHIKKQMDLALKHLDARMQKIQTTERGKKYYLLKLTGLLQDAENIKQKAVKTTQAKEGKEKNIVTNTGILEIDRVYNKTRKTIHELNISLLHQKDEIEDILVNYEESIKELFEL